MHLPIASTKTQWVKFTKISEVYFAGREWICMSSGCHILLHNVNNGKEVMIRTDEFGVELVNLITGHKSLPYFAFAEKNDFPRIIFLTCPELKPISNIKSSLAKLQCLEFSNSELFFVLSAFPSCKLEIWKYRTGQHIKSIQTRTLFPNQMLKTNFTAPVQMVQAVKDSRTLVLWRIATVAKRCMTLKDRIIYKDDQNTNNYSNYLWTSEGGFFVLDDKGHVYRLTIDHKLDRVITWDWYGDYMTNFCWYKGGMIIQGSNGIVKHYVKTDKWACDWKMEEERQYNRMISSTTKDYLIIVTDEYDLLSFNGDTKLFSLVRSDDGSITDITIIRPLGEYFVTLGQQKKIIAWNVITGVMTDYRDSPNRSVTSVKSNPHWPYISVGHGDGFLEMFSCFDGILKSIATFQLSRRKIDKISYSEEGTFVLAANMEIGHVFIVEGRPGEKFTILTSVLANEQIADFIMVGTNVSFRLFMILVTSEVFIAGNTIARFCVNRNELPEVTYYSIENPKRLYSKIHKSRNAEIRDRVFYAVPMHVKNLHILQRRRGDTELKIIKRIKTQHMMKCIRYSFEEFFTMSYAYDGLVIFRTPDDKKITNVIMPHHRSNGGIVLACSTPDQRYVITLGRDNLLLCSYLPDVEVDRKIQRKCLMKMIDYKSVFLHPTIGFNPTGIFEGTSYHEYKRLAKFEEERIANEDERAYVFGRMQAIQDKISELLELNCIGPENEYLPIEIFRMNKEEKVERLEEIEDVCDDLIDDAYELIEEQDRISELLKKTYWETSFLQVRSIFGLFSDFSVQSYVTLPRTEAEIRLIERIEDRRRNENTMNPNDIFQPWVIMEEEVIKLKRESEPELKLQEYKPSRLSFFDDDEFELTEAANLKIRNRKRRELENYTAFAGTIAHLYIERSEGHYEQQECITYSQHRDEIHLALYETLRMRDFFNQEFDTMMSRKFQEVDLINERNDRLQFILSEYKFFGQKDIRINRITPDWKQQEDPIRLTRIEDSEIPYEPYVSPSESVSDEDEHEDEIVFDEEFREDALVRMMDGVLEVKWENEIRKDIPKPKCMIDKDPMKYNEEDLRNILDYEEKVVHLNSERERYRNMLNQEYEKIIYRIERGIRRFNYRLRNLVILKLHVEACIQQEILKINRLVRRDDALGRYRKRHLHLRRVLVRKKKITKKAQSMVRVIQKALVELRIALEDLRNKEKNVEKYFRRDFQEYHRTQMDIIIKLYRKRPRATLKNITSCLVMWETARCIATHETSSILSHDALQFIKSLEAMEQFGGLPHMIDLKMFNMMCQHRRIRIECEIRLRAGEMEVAEAERSLDVYKKCYRAFKRAHVNFGKKVKAYRHEKLHVHFKNELQLIVKQGHVVLPRTGLPKDFKKAVTCRRKIVRHLNKKIIKRGKVKMRTLAHSLVFKGKVIVTEWIYKRKKMRMEDLALQHEELDEVKMTKTIQNFIKIKKRDIDLDELLDPDIDLKCMNIKMRTMNKMYKQDLDATVLKLSELTEETDKISKQIVVLNYDICEFNMIYDPELAQMEADIYTLRKRAHLKKGNLLMEIQENYRQILILQGELELARMATFPILDYKIDV